MRKLLLTVLVLFAADARAQTFVAAANAVASSASAVTVTQTINAGDLALMCSNERTNTTSTITMSDSSGSNTWTQTASGYANTPSGRRYGCFYSILAAQVTTIKATWSGSLSTTVEGITFDVSSVASSSPEDHSVNSGSSSAGTSYASGSLTTTNANDILIYGVDLNSTSTVTAGAGFTIPTNGHGSTHDTLMYEVVSATQSNLVTTPTGPSATYDGIFMSFKASSGGAAVQGLNKRRRYEDLEE